MNPAPAENPAVHERVLTDVDPIQETHLSEPGLLVIDVAGMDDETVLAFQNAIARTWATSTADRTTQDPGAHLRFGRDQDQDQAARVQAAGCFVQACQPERQAGDCPGGEDVADGVPEWRAGVRAHRWEWAGCSPRLRRPAHLAQNDETRCPGRPSNSGPPCVTQCRA
ncbi:DUF6207 family protein [Streptomyces avermitilis]